MTKFDTHHVDLLGQNLSCEHNSDSKSGLIKVLFLMLVSISVRLPASSPQLLSQVSPPASQAQDHPQPPARPTIHVICVEKKLKTRKV